jgi:hypothetical protein
MNKKVFTFFMMAILSIMGAKADVIPSSYYSEPAAGDFYLYNVNQGQFLERLNSNFPGYRTTPVAVTLASSNGNYTIQFSDGMYLHTGYWNNQYLWTDGESAKNTVHEWAFDAIGGLSNTYQLKRTVEETINGITGTFYANGTNAAISPTDDCKWALITEADYYKYLASTTTVPSYYYTTTPTAGTYYLYNVEKGGFIYRGGDGAYAGLKETPAPLTLTSAGSNAFYIRFSDGKYLKTGEYSGCYVWTDASTEEFAWTFESFHGVSGLFLVKCPLNDVDRYLYSTGIGTRGVNGWTTPDDNMTNYAWALISATDYPEWQNSNKLISEVTGYSAENDINNVNVTIIKSMTANVWNTFVVPFDMVIPSGWTVMEPTAFDGSTLTFGDASSIVAGKPYIVKPTEAVTSFSAPDVTLKKDLENTTVGDVTMTGTYEQMNATEGSYIIGIKNGESALYKVNSEVSVKPFRAYFTVSGSSSARSIKLNFSDTVTGIENAVKSDETEVKNNVMYNLSGQRVGEDYKGIFVKNGKKYINK